MTVDRTATRHDLTFLRRRAQRGAPAQAAPGALNLTPRGATSPAPPAEPAPAASTPAPSLNLSAPSAPAGPPPSLDLSAPAAPAPEPPAPEPPAGPVPSLNRSAPAPAGPAPSLNLSAPGGGGPAPSLNLSAPAAPAAPAAAATPPAQPSAPVSLSLSHPGRPPIGAGSMPEPAATPASAPAGGAAVSLNLAPTPPAAASPATAASGASPLTLSQVGQPASASTRQTPVKPPSRRVTGRTMLSADDPTVTLDRRQSAVGSLVFEVDGPGAVSAFWELQDGTAGLVDERDRCRISPEFGRRPIVELHQSTVVIGLRHVRELRRALILLSGFQADQSQRVLATLHDQATFESTHTPVGEYVVALAVYNVDGELVVRREGFGFESTAVIETRYDVKKTWLPPVHRPG